MWWKRTAPTPQGTEQGQIKTVGDSRLHLHSHNKGTQLSLTPLQNKVKTLLSDGGQYSTAEISIALHIADPRSEVRRLRHSGVEVSDVWVKGYYGNRFKRYFIHRGL